MTETETESEIEILHCFNHPSRETAVRCGKCDRPICTRCMVQTPVGMRCRECAQLRRLPQYDVSLLLLGRAAPAGLLVSALAWYLTSFVPFFRFWLGFVIGIGVGEVMSRLSKRRSNLVLEALAVIAVVAGFLIGLSLRDPGILHAELGSAGQSSGAIFFLLPAVVASIMAVVRLR